MVPPTLWVFSLIKANLVYQDAFSISNTSTNEGYTRVMFEFVTLRNAESSDVNNVSWRRLLVTELTVWNFFVCICLTDCLPMTQITVARSALSLVVRALEAVFDLGGFPGWYLNLSSFGDRCFKFCSVALQIVAESESVIAGTVPDNVPFQDTT